MNEDPKIIIRYRVQRFADGVWWNIWHDPYDTLKEARNAKMELILTDSAPVRIMREKVEFEEVEEE